ncbi:MAG: hypothetical protein KAH10_08390 [Flavobacteriales bacterium]|nr:hypothetical protein [Flavobacteriales bacterium]
MEKWRIYLILAGIVLVAYNVENIDFSDIAANPTTIIALLASIAFIVMLIVFRKK